MKVYIAGPYTKPDPVTNTAEAILAGDSVAYAGHIPFIPHLFLHWHMMSAHDYEFWMKQSGAWLDNCDALIRLPGESAGADREIEQARELGIPIFYGVDNFLAHQSWSASFCCLHCGGSIFIEYTS